MIKVVERARYTEVKKSSRFDSKYYYLGEILDKILSKFETHPISYFSKAIRKGIFDLNSKLYYCSRGLLKAELIKKGELKKRFQPTFKNEYIEILDCVKITALEQYL